VGASYSGSTTVSKTVSVGSIPTAPATSFANDVACQPPFSVDNGIRSGHKFVARWQGKSLKYVVRLYFAKPKRS
jgi:hypothetical protein